MAGEPDGSTCEWDDLSWALLDEAVRKLERAWDAVRIPRLCEFVPVGQDDPRYDEMLVRLIALDRECRSRLGSAKDLEAYLAEYPRLRDRCDLFEALEESGSHEGRKQPTPTKSYEEQSHESPTAEPPDLVASRKTNPLKILCPRSECRNRIDVVAEELPEVVRCPACGDSFNLFDAGVPVTRLGEGRVRIKRQFDDFVLIEQLGTGGFGSVWKAKDTKLHRIVAVKIPRYGRLGVEQRERFVREAQAAAQLRHSNIVAVHAVGGKGEQLYIASEFVDGLSLDEWLAGRRLSFQDTARLCATIAEATHYAHEQGIIHRDLKPQNILIDAEDQPHVTDFGLAKRDAREIGEADESEIGKTMEGAVMGTAGYLSPEQAAGKSHLADRRSDVYSLGVILFELLTGELPFRGSQHMLLRQHAEDDPPSPRRLQSSIPRDLETICLKCLEKEPGQRYQTAKELGDDVRRFINAEAVLARPISQAARLWRWCRRNRLVAALMATVVASLFIGIALTSYFAIEASNRAADLEESERALRDERNSALSLAAENAKLAQDKTELAASATAARGLAEQRLARAEWLLYASQIERAQQYWNEGDARVAWKYLDACRGDFRGWEHDYLFRLFTINQHTFRGHDSIVTSVAFSPDGLWIASGSEDKTLKLWDARSGRETVTLKGHTGAVSSVAFSPDGRRIVSGSGDNTLKVWDAPSGQETLTLKGHSGPVSSVAFSPDGRRIASGSYDKTLRLWDTESGQETLTLKGHAGPVLSVAFSPEGRRVVSGSIDNTIRLWDTESGQETLTLRGHGSIVGTVAFSLDGRRIASAGGTLDVWDAKSGQETLTLRGHTNDFISVAFSPDGRRIVSGSLDRTLKVWDAKSGQEMLTLRGHTDPVSSVAFSPDGRRIASGSYDRTLKVWDAERGQETVTLIKGHTDWVESVAFSPDGRRIVSAGGDNTLKLWDVESGQEMVTLKGHTYWVHSVAFSPDGRRIVSGSEDKTLKVWDAQSGQEMLTLRGHTGPVESVAFSPDGRRIVSGNADNTVGSRDYTLKVWNVQSGQEMLTLRGHTGWVSSVAFSPDGRRIVSASGDNTLKLWDVESGQETVTLKGHTYWVHSVAFSPDGRRIVSGSEDKTLKVWDAQSGQEMLTLRGHTGPVSSVAFSPDGRRIVSGSKDSTIRLWDTGSGQETPLSPDGKRVGATVFRGPVRVWQAGGGMNAHDRRETWHGEVAIEVSTPLSAPRMPASDGWRYLSQAR